MLVLLAANTAWPAAAIPFGIFWEYLGISVASLEPFKQGCIGKEGLSAKCVMYQAQLKYNM